ncbi:YlbG family protein [Streptococcus ictaluri]|uniref:UPF0298 protein STRIC_2243 n=1 Tax=Streptococcus ictaluri 707-05 TaxID=764299 RepID=G5K1I5_9STRE|nr:YlbG family protein [Streptococcus ictaluri]EHI70306.1 hypothetical protein STRIC_2243 [Streptococcus ictaluri 707-05]
MFQKKDRIGLVIYLYYNRDARKVMKYGDLYYHSKRSRYLVIYINKEDLEAKVQEISKLKFVREVKPSVLDTIDCDFVGNLHREEPENQAELS